MNAMPALLNAAGAVRDHGAPVGGSSGGLWGIPAEHVLGLFAPFLLPAAIWLFLRFVRGRADGGQTGAVRWLAGYDAATPTQKAASLALLVAGAVHLGLVPGHWAEARGLAVLFLLNAVCFAIAGVAVFHERWWRPFAIVLIVATLLAYIQQIGAGKEMLDQVGVLTLLDELLALGLTLLPEAGAVAPSRRRLAVAGGGTVAALLLCGSVMWVSELKTEAGPTNAATMTMAMGDQPMQGMIMQAVPNSPPTPEQQAAAQRLADETRAAIAKYEDPKVALADGYRPVNFGKGKTAHWANPAYARDGRTLDPSRPEDLVYANTPNGPKLLGAMFLMPRPGGWGPDFGGPLTVWHQHDNICFGPGAGGLAGLMSPFDTCAAGTFNIRSSAMIHLWTVDVPGGPWAELGPDQVATLLGLDKPASSR
jgi:hypothetical protein